MTDRELLELAAKAAGGVVRFDISPDQYPWLQTVVDDKPQPYPKRWNPLVDDGDALRLMVQLRLHVSVFADAIGVGVPGAGYIERRWSNDPVEAVRRAIVQTVAEMQ